MPRLAGALLALLVGCPRPALTFLTPGDIDRAAGRGDIDTVCLGFEQRDEEARERAASVLKSWDGPGADCVCDHLVRDGAWDGAVLAGLRGAGVGSQAGCAAGILDDPTLPDRAGAARLLLDVRIPEVRARLAKAASEDLEPAVRAASMPILRGTTDPRERSLLRASLGSPDPLLAAAAAGALAGVEGEAEALRGAVSVHPSASVRLAALESYQSLHTEAWASTLCEALGDPAPEVRTGALGLAEGSRDPEIWSCVRRRATTEDPDPTTRLAMLDALARSSDPAAADILCGAMPHWVRAYIGDSPVVPESDADIFARQNRRDFERSYACVEAAVLAGGSSPEGNAYLCSRYRELGGRRSVAGCPRRSSGAREVTF
jgi:hypothetical protein